MKNRLSIFAGPGDRAHKQAAAKILRRGAVISRSRFPFPLPSRLGDRPFLGAGSCYGIDASTSGRAWFKSERQRYPPPKSRASRTRSSMDWPLRYQMAEEESSSSVER